jgi:trans-aconitate methyltransferase
VPAYSLSNIWQLSKPWRQLMATLGMERMLNEFDGKKYEKASNHQKEWGNKLISELNLNGSENVLDLGCGDGTVTRQIAKLVPHGTVLGIDASKGMINAALPKELSNLRFRLLDINDIDFNEQFDVVFSNAALHWVKNHEQLLKNVHNALRINGRLRFNFAGDGNCSNFFKVIKEAMANRKFSKYFERVEWPWYMPTIEEYLRMAGKSKLDRVKVWGENADRYFPDKDAMIRWIDQPSIVPLISQVDEKNKDAFRNFVVNRMIEETEQDDGKCFETFRRINILAVK